MQGFVQLDVTSGGRTYVEHVLQGVNGLCEVALPAILQEGRIVAIVPEGTLYERALQFKVGGLCSRSVWSWWLAPYLSEMLTSLTAEAVVFQDLWTDRGDVKEHSPPYFITNGLGAIHYFVTGSQSVSSDLERVDRSTISYMTAVLVVDHCDLDCTVQSQEVDDSGLLHLAQCVSEMFIPAYDNESYVWWQRKP